MGRYIIKPVAERDFYIEYSDSVNNWVLAGDRVEMAESGVEEKRLQRADELGSSSFSGFDSWESRRKHGTTGLVFADIGAGVGASFKVAWENIEPMLREWEASGAKEDTDEERAVYEKYGVLWEPWKEDE